jgi:hypothetical protein
MNDELLIMIAIIRKLGGEVELTDKDLMDAADFALERSEIESFTGGIRYRTRLAPVTVEGELADELEAK